jgi:hypothetical protein
MRFTVLCSLATALIIVACSTSSEPASSEAVDVGSKSTSTVQSTSVENEWVPYSTTVRNPCTGGFVRFSGKAKLQRIISNRGNGDLRFRGTLLVRASGSDAAGDQYTLISTRTNEYFEAEGGCPWVFEEKQTYRVTTAGGGNNFLMTVLFRVTADCEGAETVEIIDEGGECL